MATAQFTTVVDRAVGDPLTEAIWDDQLKDNLNQLAGAHRNLLTNGGFEVWQRGAGPFTTAVYTADRWLVTGGGSYTITQETTTVDGGASSLKAVTAGGGSVTLNQKIEDHRSLRGKTISLSIRIHPSALVNVQISGAVSSSSIVGTSGTGSYQTVVVSHTVASNETSLSVIVSAGASTTCYLDSAMLVIGPAPAPYQPLHPQEDLARCQRYYEVLDGVNFLGSANGAHLIGQWVPFAVRKGGTPTATKNGTWAVTNCAQPLVTSPAAGGFTLYAIATAAGQVQYNTNSADDTVTAEWNP